MRLTTFQNVGWHEILKIVVSEDPPQTPLGELTTFPQIPSSWVASCLRQSQLRAFGSCNFTDSPLQVLVGSPGSRSQFVHSGPPILNSRIHLVYDSIICVELMNYGYLCCLCPHPIYIDGFSVPITKNPKFSQYLSPTVIHRFTPLDISCIVDLPRAK